MIDQKIYYKKVRDLGTIFSAMFGFIKQNFKPLYGSLLFFAGPFLLVAAVISANMFGSGLSMNRLFKGGLTSFYSEFIISYSIILAVVFIGITVYNVILNKNLIENEKLSPQEPLTINLAIRNFFSDFWRVLGNSFLLIILFLIFCVVLGLLFAGLLALAQSDRGNNNGVIGAFVLLAILMFFSAIFFGPILAFVPLAAIFVCQRDHISIFAAIRKVFFYMKGNFWGTWVTIMVGLLTYMVISLIVQIPFGIITLITTFSRLKTDQGYNAPDQSTSLLLTVVIAISSLLSYGVRVIFNLIVIYQYTSLEEKKDGASIIDKINQIQ